MRETHSLKATMVDGSIIVTNASGNPVKVRYGGTMDGCTVTARSGDIGLIGGWQCLKRAPTWSALASAINAGIVYGDINDLPGPRHRRPRR